MSKMCNRVARNGRGCLDVCLFVSCVFEDRLGGFGGRGRGGLNREQEATIGACMWRDFGSVIVGA